MKTYEHNDQLGQSIKVGQLVTFSYAHSRRIFVGQVRKLTKQRVRMAFNNKYDYKGETHTYPCQHLARPEDVIVLGDDLQQHLTLATLQKKI